MTNLNPESIAALLELEAKAFDGTWEVSPHFDKKLRQRDLIRKVPGGADVILGTISDYEDASLIAAARNLIRPLAEAYQRQPDAIKAVQVEALRGMREPLIDVLTHLIAAHSLLSRSPKKAAPSDKMFDQMLVDYERSIERGREAIAELDRRILNLEQS